MTLRPFAFCSVLIGSLLLTACSGFGAIEIPTPSTGSGAGGDAGAGGAGGDTSTNGGNGGTGASVSPVLVGITPTPASPFGAPTASDAISAELTTFAASARAAVIAVPWDIGPGELAAFLSERTAFYAKNQRKVAINIAVVDRLADNRPLSLGGAPWDAKETLELLRATIDIVFASSGDELRYLTFGRDIDVYLAAHPDERPDFLSFAKEACTYAAQHEDVPKSFRAGLAFSFTAPKDEPSFTDFLDLCDVIAFSYFPGLGTFEPGASAGAASVIAQLADTAGSKPIVLQAAGFASAPSASGSEDAQQKFFATLFGAVAARRSSFALVNVTELHDSPTCLDWASSQGEDPDSQLAAYACSLGVHDASGAPKPAWSAVLAGAASLSTP